MIYKGWTIYNGPAHPVTGRFRAVRHEVWMGATTLDQLRTMIDLREAPRFHPTNRFTHALISRFEDRPDGPQMPSMVQCALCPHRWNKHQFSDGACPL